MVMASQDYLSRIASGDVIQGDAAVDLGLDGIGDLLVFLADDPYLHPTFSHGGGLIGDHGIQDDEDDAVQSLFQLGIRDLEKRGSRYIKAVHGHNRGKYFSFFQEGVQEHHFLRWRNRHGSPGRCLLRSEGRLDCGQHGIRGGRLSDQKLDLA